jgi:hypothetical protein
MSQLLLQNRKSLNYPVFDDKRAGDFPDGVYSFVYSYTLNPLLFLLNVENCLSANSDEHGFSKHRPAIIRAELEASSTFFSRDLPRRIVPSSSFWRDGTSFYQIPQKVWLFGVSQIFDLQNLVKSCEGRDSNPRSH